MNLRKITSFLVFLLIGLVISMPALAEQKDKNLRVLEPTPGTTFLFYGDSFRKCSDKDIAGEDFDPRKCENLANYTFEILKPSGCIGNTASIALFGKKAGSAWESVGNLTKSIDLNTVDSSRIRISIIENGNFDSEGMKYFFWDKLSGALGKEYDLFKLAATCRVESNTGDGNELVIISPENNPVQFKVPLGFAEITGDQLISCVNIGSRVTLNIDIKAFPNTWVTVVVLDKNQDIIKTAEVQMDGSGKNDLSLENMPVGSSKEIHVAGFYGSPLSGEPLDTSLLEQFLENENRLELASSGLKVEVKGDCPELERGEERQCEPYDPEIDDIPADNNPPGRENSNANRSNPGNRNETRNPNEQLPAGRQLDPDRVRRAQCSSCSRSQCTYKDTGKRSEQGCTISERECKTPSLEEISECTERNCSDLGYDISRPRLYASLMLAQSRAENINTNQNSGGSITRGRSILTFGDGQAKEAIKLVQESKVSAMLSIFVYRAGNLTASNLEQKVMQKVQEIQKSFSSCTGISIDPRQQVAFESIKFDARCLDAQNIESHFTIEGNSVASKTIEQLRKALENPGQFEAEIQNTPAVTEDDLWTQASTEPDFNLVKCGDFIAKEYIIE